MCVYQEPPKMKLGNVNEMTNYNLNCIFCGKDKKLSLVAHRNEDEFITGFIVTCRKCLGSIEKDRKYVQVFERLKLKEVKKE